MELSKTVWSLVTNLPVFRPLLISRCSRRFRWNLFLPGWRRSLEKVWLFSMQWVEKPVILSPLYIDLKCSVARIPKFLHYIRYNWCNRYHFWKILLDFLNSFYLAFKFTQEIKVHQQLNFLDLTICKATNSLEYKIYRKPTFTYTVIPSGSYQSYKVKMQAFHSLTHRILHISLTKTNYNFELDKIHSIATNNGYPSSMIDRMIHRKRRVITRNSIYPILSENHNNTFYKLNYVKGISNKIINILKK